MEYRKEFEPQLLDAHIVGLYGGVAINYYTNNIKEKKIAFSYTLGQSEYVVQGRFIGECLNVKRITNKTLNTHLEIEHMYNRRLYEIILRKFIVKEVE